VVQPGEGCGRRGSRGGRSPEHWLETGQLGRDHRATSGNYATSGRYV